MKTGLADDDKDSGTVNYRCHTRICWIPPGNKSGQNQGRIMNLVGCATTFRALATFFLSSSPPTIPSSVVPFNQEVTFVTGPTY